MMNSMQFKKIDETTILSRLKTLLGITGEDKDTLLQFALDDTKMIILNYCNLTFIPKGLETVWLKMAIEFYKSSGASTGSINVGASASGKVSSISEGDTSVSFDTSNSTGSTSAQTSTTDGLINNYIVQLNQFRKVRR